MSELIGKINAEFKYILNQQVNIIEDFDVATIESIDFTPSHKLDEDEWFKLSNFSQNDFYINVCNSTYSTASINQIDNNDYREISAIGIFQNGQKHFQRITPSLFVNRKTILDYSGAPQIVEHRKQIEIKNESDAVYIASNDTLYFKTIGKLKQIFPGIEELHREATQEEVDTFVDNDFIKLDGIEALSIGVLNRKRIADIGLKYSNLSDSKKNALIAYAKEKAGVEIEDDSFIIKSETDLKNVLYAMDQRYYYADIYEENRVASSVRVVSN
ncbi:MAG TPA: hypothetical protein VK050_03685 [Flavobacteriaceae bacterium]|nr:hypothetical protein [Flavobacteriaceae bacterium]